MRTRAFRPEVSGCLEDRQLLSGLAAHSADPVVLKHRRLAKAAELIHLGFQLFAEDREFSGLRSEISKGLIMIPYAKADGLGVSIDRILNEMQDDLAHRVPRAMRTARSQVLAATLATVEARVQAGDVVIIR